MKWKHVQSDYKFENAWVKVRVDQVIKPNGASGEYTVLEATNNVAVIVPLTKDGKFVLQKIERYPIKKVVWECPMGRIEEKDYEYSAKRELAEETGYQAGKIELLGEVFPLNGICSEKNYIFLASKLENGSPTDQESEAISEVREFTQNEIIEMIRINEISDSQTISALFKAMLFLGSLQNLDNNPKPAPQEGR